MKKRKYDVWYWEKIKVDKLDIYKFWNEDKSECYFAFTLSHMLNCWELPTKEAREKYIRDLSIIFLYFYCLVKAKKKNSVE